MNKYFVGLAAVAAISTLSFTAQAQTYGAAGCGLGSVVFQNSPGIVQIFAATTNGTSGSQTFGITSGTSNCAAVRPGPASARAFVETNREAVAKDIARGGGETIKSLAKLAGCKDHGKVGQKLQQNYSKIFTTAKVSDRDVSNNVLTVLKQDKTTCKNVG